MDFYKVPLGFGMALSMNPAVLNAYSAVDDAEKQALLDRAHHAQSEPEMHRIVDSLAQKQE